MKLVNRKLTEVLVQAFCVFAVSTAAVSAQANSTAGLFRICRISVPNLTE
jgi:hypothetical protein